MNKTHLNIEEIQEADFDSLQPLVEEFISTHRSLSFREDYWSSFCAWLVKAPKDENILLMRATIETDLVGFVVGVIQENDPLLSPDRIGYVSIMVVDKKHRGIGIGEDLWKELRSWFLSKGVSYFELYTEFENSLAGSFWSNRGFDTFLERRRQNIENI
ncbi:MAG: GNAT family N-acetyltransferase [Deltaproteobacteria bacterium]|nr:GNAT family N-acetyltransferase [Deltaproteobacteria bacterium]